MRFPVAYRFGAGGKRAHAALAALATATEAELPALVRRATDGGERRDLVLAAVLARGLTGLAARRVAESLGDPAMYSARERLRVAEWLAQVGQDTAPWHGQLADFPLDAAPPMGAYLCSRRFPARLFPGAPAQPAEAFAAARIAIASRPGNPDAARALRDAAITAGAVDTLAALLDTGWLDALVLEANTLRAVQALDWGVHGHTALDFARRVKRWRAALATAQVEARYLAALVDLAHGDWRRAREALAEQLPGAAAPYLLACFHLDGNDPGGALAHVADRALYEFLLRHARAGGGTRAGEVMLRARAVPLPGKGNPAREALVLALARAVEVGRPTESDRAALDAYFQQVPAWRELLPPADAAWQRAARSLSAHRATAPAVAAALHDLFLVPPRAAWFVAVADRLLEGGRDRWLVDEFGSPTALGVQVHALVAHCVEALPLDRVGGHREALLGIDIVAAIRAARSIAHGQPQLFDGDSR